MPSTCIEFLEAASLAHEKSTKSLPELLSAIYNTRGTLALQINQRAEALQNYQGYMQVQEEIYANTNVATTKYAAAFTELGMAKLMNEIATDDVFELFETSDKIRRKLKGYKKLNLFNSLRGKGYWNLARGRHDEAFTFLLEALIDRENEFGEDDIMGMR